VNLEDLQAAGEPQSAITLYSGYSVLQAQISRELQEQDTAVTFDTVVKPYNVSVVKLCPPATSVLCCELCLQ
jgi:hypothetical protein